MTHEQRDRLKRDALKREPEESAEWLAIKMGGARYKKLAGRLILYAKTANIGYDEALREAVRDFLERKGL